MFQKVNLAAIPLKHYFRVPNEPFSEQYLEETFLFLTVNYILSSFHGKDLLCNGKVPRMLKVLHGTIDANKDQSNVFDKYS